MTHSEKLRQIWTRPSPLYFVGEKAETREQIVQDVIKKVMSLIRVPVDGKTPTKSEVLAIIREVMPTEKDLLKLITPLIPKVKDGIDGKTPTEKELRKIIEPLIPKVKNGEDGKTPSKEELESIIRPILLEYVGSIPKEAPKPTYDQIKGVAEPIIRQMMAEARKGWFGGGGGGDNVRAGSGISITTNNIGAKVISASGSFGVLEATGTIDDSNTTFTFTEKPVIIYVNGQALRENKGWTWSVNTATLSNPVGDDGDIYGIK